MSRTAYKFSAVIVSLVLTAALAGCGTDHKEGTPATVAAVAESTCLACHSDTTDPLSARNIVQGYLASPHNRSDAGCQGCHGGGAQHFGVGPIPFPNPVNRCSVCHNGTTVTTALGVNVVTFDNDETIQAQHLGTFLPSAGGPGNCGVCHNPHDPLNAPFVGGSCVACHAFPQDETDKAANNGGGYVNDNNGVRAIVAEFSKWSHHVTGVTLNDAHCAACHLEGKVTADGKIAVDTTKHMADARVHLRNADNDSDFPWDPAQPNHSNMDNFCMSCHDANGATSATSVKIQAFINSNHVAAANKIASASNPFGDTISNRYDKMQRPGVVDASSQFNTTNNSHHAVKGPRYSGRTRFAGDRQIASPATFASHSSALLQGVRSTIFDAGNFNDLYTPLVNAGGEAAPRTGDQTLGDDSTLHCGDCHTVGQWRVGSSFNRLGVATPDAIGAHGSNNEYLLRNSIGTDQRHTQNAFVVSGGVVTATNPNGAFLVCYNCHSYIKYGSVFLQTGVLGGHVGEYDQTGRCNGVGNTIPFNGYTTGKATDGTQFISRFGGDGSVNGVSNVIVPATTVGGTPTPLKYTTPAPYAGEQIADFGDIFGIQCSNCHNSGAGNGYGGIHGSFKNTNSTRATVNPFVTGGAYIDGMGNTTKVERFLPGLGNAAYVPGTLDGFTGGTVVQIDTAAGTPAYTYTTGGVSSDTNWEQKHWQQKSGTFINNATGAVTGGASAGAGCYTLGSGAPALPSTVHQGDNAVANGAIAPSVTGAGGPSTALVETWGGCEDHDAGQGRGDHGFVKKIVRPITY